MIGKFKQVEEGFETKKIIIWTKPIADIPAGWVVCDGNNQAPDLSDRIVRGHGSSRSVAGTSGGQNQTTLVESQLPSHNHSYTIDSTQVGDHNHAFKDNGSVVTENQDRGSESFNYTFSTGQTSNAGNHNHGFSVGATGSSSEIENRPAYTSVVYIMKL